MRKKERKLHYAWIILLGCCMLQGGTLGAIMNCSGVFYVPVCQELEIQLAQLTLYRTIAGIVSMLATPLVSRLFNRYDSRLVLTAGALTFILPTVFMGTFHYVWQWHLAAVLQGLGSNLVTILAAPVLISNWFHKKTGLALGISAASSGLVGSVMNTVVAKIVDAFGWRIGYFADGAIALLLVLPATLLLLRYQPSDKGMVAYGEEGEAEQKPQTEEAGLAGDHRSVFLCILANSVGITFAAGFSSLMNAYGVSVGLSAASAATLATVSMIGNTAGKLLSGELNDRIGTRGPALLVYSLAFAGCVTLIFFPAPLIYGSALLFGCSMPAYTTISPLMTRAALGRKDFARYYPKVTMVTALFSALMVTVHGWIYDVTGSYVLSMVLNAAGFALSIIVTVYLFWIRRKAPMKRAAHR